MPTPPISAPNAALFDDDDAVAACDVFFEAVNQEFEKIVNSADMDSLAFLPSLQIAAVENDDQSKIGFLAYVVDRILNGYEVKS